MKKIMLMLFAAAAFVGCERSGENVNEPAGSYRDLQMQPGTNDTNTISDPAGVDGK